MKQTTKPTNQWLVLRKRRCRWNVHGRSATIDGSRGFQPTVTVTNLFRRCATIDWVAAYGVPPGFMRRDATRFPDLANRGLKPFRGLKPTATIIRSLRDEEAFPGRGATGDGSRAFQRPDQCPVDVLRRVATLDVSGLRIKSRN
jgi:hypothetical protein